MITFVKLFRPYLLGPREFEIRTDHAALQWLRRTPEPIGQNARWVEALEEYLPFRIIHRAGLKHSNADALSRRPCRQCGEVTEVPGECRTVHCEGTEADVAGGTEVVVRATEAEVVEHIPVGEVDDFSMAHLQELVKEDSVLTKLTVLWRQYGSEIPREAINHESGELKTYWTQRGQLKLREGVWFKEWESADGLQRHDILLMPKGARKAFVKLAHVGATGGHLGVKKTQVQVQRRAYWHGWADDVRRVCEDCPDCARYHRGTW